MLVPALLALNWRLKSMYDMPVWDEQVTRIGWKRAKLRKTRTPMKPETGEGEAMDPVSKNSEQESFNLIVFVVCAHGLWPVSYLKDLEYYLMVSLSCHDKLVVPWHTCRAKRVFEIWCILCASASFSSSPWAQLHPATKVLWLANCSALPLKHLRTLAKLRSNLLKDIYNYRTL